MNVIVEYYHYYLDTEPGKYIGINVDAETSISTISSQNDGTESTS